MSTFIKNALVRVAASSRTLAALFEPTSPAAEKLPLKTFSFGICLLLGMLLLPSSSFTQSPPTGPFAYVTNQSGGSVTVIDTPTNTVVTTISLCVDCSPQPAGLAVTPDGKFVYVANQGNGTVSVIDASSNTVTKTISLPSLSVCDCSVHPVGVAITPDGTRAYVTDVGQNLIFVINISTNAVVFPTSGPEGDVVNLKGPIVITPDGSAAFYTFGTNSVGRFDTTSNTHTTTLTVGNNPTGIAVTPDNASIYVTNDGDTTVSVIPNTFPTFSPITTVSVGSGPYSVAITPNSQSAYVVKFFDGVGSVSVINTATKAVTPVTGLTCKPSKQIAITPDGTEAYVVDVVDVVCNTPHVSVISTASNAETATVSVGGNAFGVAIGLAATTFTTAPQPVGPGTSTTFTDGTIMTETVTIPFDANMGNPATAFKAVEFIQISPAAFASTRLPGIPQSPNWSGGTTPIPPGTTCTVIANTGGNCVVVRDLCYDVNHVQITPCNIAAGPADLIGLTYTYNSLSPQPSPGIMIADDNLKNWALLPSVFDLDCCTATSGTKKLNTETTIVTAPPTPASITNLIVNLLLANGCIDNAGIANSLTKKLGAAQDAIDSGQIQTAINVLGAFKKHVQAQTGKHIATSCVIEGVVFNPGTVLLMDAQGLIDVLRVGDIPDPITGFVASSNDVPISGATVSMLDSAMKTVATTTTDMTGFYFFATTGILTNGSNYTVKVTGLPASFTTATSPQAFTWSGSGLTFNFTLN